MQYDAALEYRKARQKLIELYPLDLAAWNEATPETHIRTYGGHQGLMFSGDFLGYIDLLSPDGKPYSEFRSVPVRWPPSRREIYGMRPDGHIEYAGYLLTGAAWKLAEDHELDAAYHRSRRRRP